MAPLDPQARIAILEGELQFTQGALHVTQGALQSAHHRLHWANLTIEKRDAQIRLLEERLRKK